MKPPVMFRQGDLVRLAVRDELHMKPRLCEVVWTSGRHGAVELRLLDDPSGELILALPDELVLVKENSRKPRRKATVTTRRATAALLALAPDQRAAAHALDQLQPILRPATPAGACENGRDSPAGGNDP